MPSPPDKEVREILEEARAELETTAAAPSLFVDELHPIQQGAQGCSFAGSEEASVILLGATEESLLA